MSRFHSLKLIRKKQETPDAVSLSFEIPAELKTAFQYKHGQYLTLKTEINGESVRRAYSLCSSPLKDEYITVAVKKVDGGKMSNFLNDQFQEGQVIEVMEPEGRFYTELSPSNKKHYYLIGGGSGITPLFSILKSVLIAEPESKITLIYGNRNAESIIFKSELDRLANENPNRFKIIYSLDDAPNGWPGVAGLLNSEKIRSLIIENQNEISDCEYFLCGPTGLMDQAKEAFKILNLPESQVHIEFFSAPVTNSPKEEEAIEKFDFEGAKVTVILNHKEYELHIKDNSTILKAALKAGIDAPFSCEAGICSTCMAKVLEGTVKMDENNILTEDEVKKGYVLTCQSHPTSKIVRLEYYD